ncbi:MAG: SDR family oxidoreductase [Pseudomonadales bacterium]|nr:SDR family oxidoreductase [Pseudomonadales bacterium]
MESDRFLNERTVLITGAGRGIGAAIALELATLSAKVILVGRTASRLETTANLIRSDSGSADVVVADVRYSEWLERLLEQQEQIDILVHAASGFAPYGPLEQRTDDDIAEVLDTNLGAALRISSLLLPGMKARNYGMFLFIGSLAGSLGAKNQVIYATAKAGYSGLVKSLVVENAALQINAHLVELGLFDTERTQEAMHDSVRERIVSAIPAGRIGLPQEVAKAVRYLLSPDAQFLRGITLPVAGGAGLGVVPSVIKK